VRGVRRLIAVLLGGCALLLAGWVGAPTASACSCALTTTAEQVAGADVVFTGTLVSREVRHPPGRVFSSGDPALHVFAVDAVHKGTASAMQTVVSADSGASCGLTLSGDGPFLVFADRAPDGTLDADACGGTTLATTVLEAAVDALAEPATPPAPGTAAALPGPVDRAPNDPMTADSGSPGAALGLEIGAAVAALLAGALAVRSRRRAARRTTVVVLTSD
jgi:hypothetical protein